MRRILLRDSVLMVSWAIGLLVAAQVVPHMTVSRSAFITGVLLFSVPQVLLSTVILRLPHGWVSLLRGGAGLVLTIVSLTLTAAWTHGLCIRGGTSWVAATVVVWLVTTLGAISLPDVLARGELGPS
ncbi:hypothetical protein [Mycobacterium sp.]|uniref:hypothetical protein n=1 Tax=Mycobacterium sp. TaxID=1785 RepID=UPI0031E3E529